MRLSVLWVLVTLVGCGALPQRPVEEVVAERAAAQASALIDRDYEAALRYVVPSYQNSARAALYEANYSGSSFWKDTSVRWVKCGDEPDTERCEVRVWVYGQAPSGGRFMSQRGDDVPWSWDMVWVKIDGQWYQYLR